MEPDTSFWQAMSALLVSHNIIVDRPKGGSHPRYPEVIYPLDYGYLENTSASDGGGIDVWLGSLNSAMDHNSAKTLTGILCTFDTLTKCRRNTIRNLGTQLGIIFSNIEFAGTSGKCDAEIKFLIGCTEEDVQIIRDFQKEMHILYTPNPMVVIT